MVCSNDGIAREVRTADEAVRLKSDYILVEDEQKSVLLQALDRLVRQV